MAYSDYLNETCTISTVTQGRDPLTLQTVETETAVYSNISCVRENVSYDKNYNTGKTGVNFTDIFYCEYLSNAEGITDQYIVVQDGIKYRVKKAVDPMHRGHHTEIYTELIT